MSISSYYISFVYTSDSLVASFVIAKRVWTFTYERAITLISNRSRTVLAKDRFPSTLTHFLSVVVSRSRRASQLTLFSAAFSSSGSRGKVRKIRNVTHVSFKLVPSPLIIGGMSLNGHCSGLLAFFRAIGRK